MEAAAINLGVGKERIGSVSNALRTGRAAVMQSGLSVAEKADAMFLMDWMEQTPISAKHIKKSQAARMMDLLP